MPALVAFGRKWQIASDDFVFPGFLDLLVRVSWLVAGCIIFWENEINLNCPGGHFLRYYLYGNFIVLLSIVFADIALIQNSMAGYIMDEESRKYVTPSLYIRLLFEIPEVGWTVMGSAWVFGGTFAQCEETKQAIFLIKGLLICNWVLVFIMIIVIALVFDPLGASTRASYDTGYERFESGVWNRNHRVWERRCRVIMCSCCGNDEYSKDAFKEVGKIMSLLFENSELVPSDIAAGLIMLHLKNQAEADSSALRAKSPVAVLSNEPATLIDELEISVALPPPDPWNSPQFVAHFMRYALASYGWPWFVIAHLKTGLCRLWKNLRCCGCLTAHPCAIEGDNCCYCNTSALKDTIKIQERDIIYASFKNHVFVSPFFIAVDHSYKCVVLSLRGTMSLRDALTDLTAAATTIDCPGLPVDVKAHTGMTTAAKNVLKKLEDLKLLSKAFEKNPDYDLVLTGHSLGAGTATILSFYLKKQYPNIRIRCYAYSPPGCLMTLEGAQFCEDWVTSIIVGDDLVPRLSIPVFERFKKNLESTIQKCRTPKYRILISSLFYFLVGGVPHIEYSDNHEDAERTTSDTNLLTAAEPTNYHTYVSLAEVSHRMQRESVTSCAMYPPGKIMHVTERPIFQSRPDLVDGPRYEYRWANRSEFTDVRVSPTMLNDHLPDKVYFALQELASADSCI